MLGWQNPMPFQIGAGPSATLRTYGAMKRAVGKGGSAKSDDGPEALWRKSRAMGLALVGQVIERAILQAWPHLATDAIPYYERVLKIVPGAGASDAARRQAIVDRWIEELAATFPGLDEQLKGIDPRISLLQLDFNDAIVTHLGRAFEAHSASDPFFLLDGYTAWPNYATTFKQFVHFDVGHVGATTASEDRTIVAIKAHLRNVLPSWVDFVVVTEVGFTLDEDPLDITAFGE